MYIMTARRMISGEVLKQRKGQGLVIRGHYVAALPGPGEVRLTGPEEGMKVLVDGRIHYTKWTDATGTNRYGCEIIAEKVDFLSRPKSAENENPELVDRDDEIPF
jgi:single-strand DNA-binding protein